jgi:hypothetical protein
MLQIERFVTPCEIIGEDAFFFMSFPTSSGTVPLKALIAKDWPGQLETFRTYAGILSDSA